MHCNVDRKCPLVKLETKGNRRAQLKKKKKCTFPKAMLLSYNNDILQSRNRDKSGKYHDIILVMVLPDSIVNFKANSVKVFFFPKY